MNTHRRLVEELCCVVSTFICPQGVIPDIEKCTIGVPLMSKGGTQALCTVKLQHGQSYNLEFVYKFWQHILQDLRYPLQPCFIISNNGLAVTLKCFLCEPRDSAYKYGNKVPISGDVNLDKNSCIILLDEDFLKFKSRHVFPKELPIYQSMVICRTYLTEYRKAIQFVIVKPANRKRVSAILDCIARPDVSLSEPASLPDRPPSHFKFKIPNSLKPLIWSLGVSLLSAAITYFYLTHGDTYGTTVQT
ncbi:tegument protein [Cricetid gammaherpesvirus 2]|uniref:Tegument protein n=1 Tax=Cricetid gammaherpesvirus 2 TaxID=1605972 RepID=E9M5Q0_9GAMA|nr:tegument protein [Cricetid gammaherpesvirus 2]ADW24408.1 tegument protein [Cricetid gammaherpesvirus 2]ADW24490.1 tegument protein [Cricetid gammaherpesvirus 2]